MCLGFYQIRTGMDPKQSKKEPKKASKTKGFTSKAAIRVADSQGVDPVWGKKVEEGLLLWRNPPSDQIFTATYCIAEDNVDTCINLNTFILVVFFSDWTVCCWLSGER